MRTKHFLKSIFVLFFVGTLIGQDKAPTFFLQDLQGNDIFGSQLYGEKSKAPRPVVVSFFATWCHPCKAEIPELQKLNEKYKKMDFFLINVKDKKPLVQKWIQSHEKHPTVLLDKYGVVYKKFKSTQGEDVDLKTMNLPFLVVINAEGKMVYRHTGYTAGDEKELDEILGEMIKE